MQADAVIDPAIFARNLEALRTVQPALAERLAGIDLSALHPTPARTRDGGTSYQIRRPDGTIGWFGRTSIPSVRAAALLEQFDAGQGNVLLAGIGEGSEALGLLRSLGRHRAVFAWEPEAPALRLMLGLHDCAEPLRQERLVLLACPLEGLQTTMAAWLSDHPGHLCPARILMWPWQSLADLTPCRQAVEAALGETERQRSQQLAETRQRLVAARHDRRAPGASPAVALIGLHAGEETCSLTDALMEGAGTLAWPCADVSIRLPSDVHPLARSRKLESSNRSPDCAILLNVTRHEVQDILPPQVPAVSWLGPPAILDASLPERLGAEPAVVTSSHLAGRVIGSGVPARQVSVLPPPCRVVASDEVLAAPRDRSVLLLADLHPLEPAAYGFHLPTQAQIWRAAVDLLQGRLDTFTTGDVGRLLTDAESRAGVRLDDNTARAAMGAVLSTHVANTLLRQHLARQLAAQQVRVCACGSGWECSAVSADLRLQSRPADPLPLIRTCQAFLLADVAGEPTAEALLAAGNGTVVLSRTHPSDHQPGGFATLLQPKTEMLVFRQTTELLTQVRHCTTNDTSRLQIATAARDRCRSDHTPEGRLLALVQRVASTPSPQPS